MTRIKRGFPKRRRKKRLIARAKGFRWRRKSHYRAAKEALLKAGKYAYRDRRAKKRSFRRLWIVRLNNAVREHGLTYRAFINLMAKKNIRLDRKVLSQLAVEQPALFAKIVETVRK